MTDTKTIDVSHIKFTSSVFPTDEDVKLWDSLTPEEQEAFLLQEEEAAYRSGVAKNASKEEIMAEVLAEMKNGL